jgi:sigma-B regulation protein RsbU (phosphoserine phosphatase)
VSEGHSLTLRNDPAELARVTAWIVGIAAQLGLTEETAYAVQVCVEEALINVISHAFEPGTTHDVQLALWRDDATLLVEVTDQGRAFDPLSHELPAPPRDLESAPIGGLGIKLIRGFASSVAYQRVGPTNRLTLSFALRPGST